MSKFKPRSGLPLCSPPLPSPPPASLGPSLPPPPPSSFSGAGPPAGAVPQPSAARRAPPPTRPVPATAPKVTRAGSRGDSGDRGLLTRESGRIRSRRKTTWRTWRKDPQRPTPMLTAQRSLQWPSWLGAFGSMQLWPGRHQPVSQQEGNHLAPSPCFPPR